MCKMHYKLSKRSPGVTEPPTAEEVDEKIAEYDVDMSGGLSKDEFFEFCKVWFDRKGAIFLQQILLTAFIGMVVLPESAGMYVLFPSHPMSLLVSICVLANVVPYCSL